jgi:hypothetical protein
MYQPLCAFKHGNPVVQRHMPELTEADRRAFIAACWALEAEIRSGWLALLAFLPRHTALSVEMEQIMRGINRAFNDLKRPTGT